MAFSLFGKKGSLAKVPSTLMIALASTHAKQRIALDFVMRKWNVHVDANHIQYMKYNNTSNTKKRSIYYFSPYTFDCFLQYLGKIIDQETYIPNTNKHTLSGFKADTYILDNVWKTNRNDKIDTNMKGIPYVLQVDKVHKYPAVPYNDEDERCYATFVIYNLLFFSYTRASLDNKPHLKLTYKNNKEVAEEFKDIFMNEYKQAHNNKSIGKGQMATMPSYKAFVDRNKDAVYIPNLTTNLQKANATTDRRDYDLNVYNIGEHNTNVGGHLRTAMAYKEMREKDKMVDNMFEHKSRQKRQAYIHQQRAKAISQKRHRRAVADWRKREIASAKASKKRKAKRAKSSSVNISSVKATKASSASSSTARQKFVQKSQNAVKQQRVRRLQRQRMIAKSKKTKIVPRKQSTSSTSASARVPRTRRSQSQRSSILHRSSARSSMKAPRSSADNKEQSYRSVAPSANTTNSVIDYSSVKQPYIITNNMRSLEKAVKDAFLGNKDKETHVQFNLMNADRSLPSPITPEIALKTGHLDSQRYVQQESNDFKKFANNFIKHIQKELNLAEQRYEINVSTEAMHHLNQKITALIDKYSDDSTLTKNALHYYKINTHDAISRIRESCNKELQMQRKALHEEMHARLERAKISIHRYFSQEVNHIKSNVNSKTIKIYRDSQTRRDTEIHKNVRSMKKETLKAIHLQLQNHRIEFKHRALQYNKLRLDYFTKELTRNKGIWINTVVNMIEAQARDQSAKVRLRKVTAEAEKSKNGSTRRAMLQREVNKAQRYADQMESRYEDRQDKYLDLRSKLLQASDKNDDLLNQIDELKEGNSSRLSESRRTLASTQDENKRLREIIDSKNRLADHLNDSITQLTQSREGYSANLDNTNNQLQASRAQIKQYKEMLHRLQQRTLGQSQKVTQWYQKYTNMKIALDNTHATNRSEVSATLHSASMAQMRSSASISQSVSQAFQASLNSQNLNQDSIFSDRLREQQSIASANKSYDDSRVSSAISEASMANASNANQSRMASISMSSASVSASVAQIVARSKGAREALQSASQSYSFAESVAREKDANRAQLSASTVRSVQASANSVIASANKSATAVSHRKPTQSYQSNVNSTVSSIEASANAVKSSAKATSVVASQASSKALSQSSSIITQSLKNKSIAESQSIHSAVQKSVSASMRQVNVQTAQVNASRSTNNVESSSASGNAFTKAAEMDKDAKINNLQREINELNQNNRHKRRGSHKHWWQA